MEDLSADSLILTCKFVSFRIQFIKENNIRISDKFKTFCRSLNIQQAFSSSYHHHSNGQMEECIKVIKHSNCFDTKSHPHIALLQIRSTPLKPRLPSPTTLLCNSLIRGIMPTINRPLIGVNNDDEY